MDALQRLHRDENGQGTTEYVIILLGISLVTIALAVAIGDDLVRLFTGAKSDVDTLDAVVP